MKKTILLLTALTFLFFKGICQTNDSTANKHTKINEIKINSTFLLFLGYLDFSYERVLKNETSYGIALGTKLSKGSNSLINFSVTPYYRVFFNWNTWLGKINQFFIETNLSLYQEEERIYDSKITSVKHKNLIKAGVGFAFGKKFYNKNGFVAEFLLGAGRDLTDLGKNSFYPRIGINLGKSF